MVGGHHNLRDYIEGLQNERAACRLYKPPMKGVSMVADVSGHTWQQAPMVLFHQGLFVGHLLALEIVPCV